MVWRNRLWLALHESRVECSPSVITFPNNSFFPLKTLFGLNIQSLWGKFCVYLFARIPFWVLTQFSKAICPRHSLGHLTYSFLDTIKDFVLKTFFHNLFHCLRECFVNQLVALYVRMFCKQVSSFFESLQWSMKKFGA